MKWFFGALVILINLTVIRAMEQENRSQLKDKLEFVEVNDLNLKHADKWIIDIHDFNPDYTPPKKSIRRNIDKALDRSTKRREIRQNIEDAIQKKDLTMLAQIQNNINMDAFQQLNQALDDAQADNRQCTMRATFWGAIVILGLGGQLALAAYSASAL